MVGYVVDIVRLYCSINSPIWTLEFDASSVFQHLPAFKWNGCSRKWHSIDTHPRRYWRKHLSCGRCWRQICCKFRRQKWGSGWRPEGTLPSTVMSLCDFCRTTRRRRWAPRAMVKLDEFCSPVEGGCHPPVDIWYLFTESIMVVYPLVI